MSQVPTCSMSSVYPANISTRGRDKNGDAPAPMEPPGFVGDSVAAPLVGDVFVLPAARTVAGDALFCLRKGDWRPVELSNGDGREAWYLC